ncbi:GPI ethanolamine phosphate transferase 3-like isoform X2 [Ornithodoros turicata]|uniref:GPI ethanolamine phosphate transferase 3-like isoform X2 n=1 Tax=Ornithodoros turicata TaxID=34597 RepID=UPI00313A23CD
MYRPAVFCTAIIVGVSGTLLFSAGFLLQRRVSEHHSSCADINETFYKSTGVDLGLSPTECWYPARFKKAVVLLIDALKYEFAVYGPPWNDAEYYRNKMTIFSELLSQNKSNAILFKFVADAPTTTLQRLKGLMTGSLPTFIDAGSNFYQASVQEDSIVEQLHKVGKRIVLMGDDTWTQLFPKRFHREYAYPSFYVKDLHTVDNAVLEHLYPELHEPNNWDVLIGHVLGVDHCGHWFGRDHPSMAAKLRQMDQAIRNITSLLGPDTLLVIMSDHGMTADGDHGGDTEDEVEAMLFLYSVTPFLQHRTVTALPPGDDTVEQLDFASTFSLLLGVPIPYSNLGGFIEPVAPIRNVQEALPLWINVQQVARYFAEMKTLGDPKHQLSQLQALWDACLSNEKDSLDNFVGAARTFLKVSRTTARKAWTTFDLRLMTGGLFVSCFSILLMLAAAGSSFRRLQHEMWVGTAACTIFWVLAPFSNSYLIYENKVTLFLLQSMLVMSAVRRWRHVSLRGLLATLAILAATRCASFFWRCRDEHAGTCDPDPLMAPLDTSGSEGIMRVVVGGATNLAVAAWCSVGQVMTRKGKPSTPGPLWGSLRAALVGAALSISAYWLVQLRPPHVLEKMLGSNQESLVKVAHLLCGCVLVVIMACPTMVQRKAWRLSFLMASGALGLVIGSLAGESYAPALGILAAAAGTYFMLLQNHENLTPPWWHLSLCWLLWGQLGFFSTGHQATFASIHWKSAMVGATSSPTMQGAAVRTLINTFSGPLIAAWGLAPLAALHHQSKVMQQHGSLLFASTTLDGLGNLRTTLYVPNDFSPHVFSWHINGHSHVLEAHLRNTDRTFLIKTFLLFVERA